jgi:drug/metabolite transporter superfamily protein YnfA
MKINLGRQVFGLAAILFGVFTLTWHDFNTWQQIQPLDKILPRQVLAYFIAAIEIFGGFAIQWRRTVRAGALALGGVYLAFALLWIPRIAAKPQSYDPWGNFFEQFSQVAGALIVYASFDRGVDQADSGRTAKIARFGYISFGVCVISFTFGQLFYLSDTAQFVPKWVPPGQMFWAVTTTIAFALAAIALLSGVSLFWRLDSRRQ